MRVSARVFAVTRGCVENWQQLSKSHDGMIRQLLNEREDALGMSCCSVHSSVVPIGELA